MTDGTDGTGRRLAIDRPNVARMYDYFLGGSHNFAIDREAAEATLAVMPQAATMARENRAFLRRAVSWLARTGVRQYLDLGSGIPTAGNVHEIAQRHEPDSRVVYVDIEPVAVSHSRTLLADNPKADVVEADLRDPEQILAAPAVGALFDLDRPLAVLAVAVLHFIGGADDPAAILTAYRRALPPGSYLVVSHGSHDGQSENTLTGMRAAAQVYERTGTSFVPRDRDEIAALFEGWEFVEPGLVRLPLWRPENPEWLGPEAERFAAWAGVARLPE